MAAGQRLGLDAALLLVLLAAEVAVHLWMQPRVVPQPLASESVSHPHLPDIVPAHALLAASLLLPFACYFGLEAVAHGGARVPLGAFAVFFVETVVVTELTTDVIKNLVGRPRPHFAEACGSYLSDSLTECTGSGGSVAEARRSFPSGHASLAFSVGTLVALYFGHRTSQRDFERRVVLRGTARLLLVCAPLLAATLVGVSRIIDYHHNYSDVVAGALLGAGVAGMAFANRRETDLVPVGGSDHAAPLLPTTTDAH